MPAMASQSLDDIHEVVAFFEERRGRLMASAGRTMRDFKSCVPAGAIAADRSGDRRGDGVTAASSW